jgi:hypothetical protein
MSFQSDPSSIGWIKPSGVTFFAASWPWSSGRTLDRRLAKAIHCFEWADIKQDIKAFEEITIEDRGKT